MDTDISDDYRLTLKKMREKYRGFDLAKNRFAYLKEIFENRSTVNHLKKELSRDTSNLATDMTSYKKFY